ncbi:MAG: hypothetical protein II998_11645 [Clostridia bacterium]|nr:hypothetical protein [Clostridia bacterium]
MKRILIVVALLLFFMTVTVMGETSEVTVITSPFKVIINDISICENVQYPALFYRGVIYIPMTFDVGKSIGKSIEWVDGYSKDVLLLTETEKSVPGKNVDVEIMSSQTVDAELANCTVAVCIGESINFIDGTEEYPLLRYKDIIYIPLTWGNIVEKFGWSYTFEETEGICLDVSQTNVDSELQKDIYTSEDGSTTCYILERKMYIDDYGYDATDWIGLIRYNHDMTGKRLWCLGMGEFVVEKELSHPVKKGDIRFFKTYKENEFKAPQIQDSRTILHSATTMMLDTRTGCINKWNTIPSWRNKAEIDENTGYYVISMSETDYVSDSIEIINSEKVDIELKSIPMTYVIKRIDDGRDEVVLTYDVPHFAAGNLLVPASTSSTITKVLIRLPQWDFRDANGEYVPEGDYEIILNVPDSVEYVKDGETIILDNPKGVFINSKIKLTK